MTRTQSTLVQVQPSVSSHMPQRRSLARRPSGATSSRSAISKVQRGQVTDTVTRDVAAEQAGTEPRRSSERTAASGSGRRAGGGGSGSAETAGAGGGARVSRRGWKAGGRTAAGGGDGGGDGGAAAARGAAMRGTFSL